MLRKLSAPALIAVSVVLLAAAPSAASSSVQVSGNVAPTGTQSASIRSADGNTVFDEVGTHAWSGSLTGTSVVSVHFVLHSNGTVTYEGHVTFTGTTPCGAGTVQFEAQGQGPFPGPLEGTATTIAQGSSTVSMHAGLDTVLLLTMAGAAGSYTGEVNCG